MQQSEASRVHDRSPSGENTGAYSDRVVSVSLCGFEPSLFTHQISRRGRPGGASNTTAPRSLSEEPAIYDPTAGGSSSSREGCAPTTGFVAPGAWFDAGVSHARRPVRTG